MTKIKICKIKKFIYAINSRLKTEKFKGRSIAVIYSDIYKTPHSTTKQVTFYFHC